MSKTNQIRSIEQYSLAYDIFRDLPEVPDDTVNAAYNYFHAERMKYYHGVFVKLNNDFKAHKTSNPAEWHNFISIVRICQKSGFHLRCYIKYTFLNKLVTIGRGHSFADSAYLRNPPQIIEYAKKQKEIERLYDIYVSIQKTILLIKKIMKTEKIDAKSVIKKIISSGRLNEYITTAAVSPYFLAMIKNASLLIHKICDMENEDNNIIIYVCNRMNDYRVDALKAMSMFYPNSTTETIVSLCQK